MSLKPRMLDSPAAGRETSLEMMTGLNVSTELWSSAGAAGSPASTGAVRGGAGRCGAVRGSSGLRRTQSPIVAANQGGGKKKKRSNSPMWMIESESADFHSWLQKTATSNIAAITFMLSRDISSPQKQKKHGAPCARASRAKIHRHEASGLCPSVGRSGKFRLMCASGCSRPGVTGRWRQRAQILGGAGHRHPVEIPTLDHGEGEGSASERRGVRAK